MALLSLLAQSGGQELLAPSTVRYSMPHLYTSTHLTSIPHPTQLSNPIHPCHKDFVLRAKESCLTKIQTSQFFKSSGQFSQFVWPDFLQKNKLNKCIFFLTLQSPAREPLNHSPLRLKRSAPNSPPTTRPPAPLSPAPCSPILTPPSMAPTAFPPSALSSLHTGDFLSGNTITVSSLSKQGCQWNVPRAHSSCVQRGSEARRRPD